MMKDGKPVNVGDHIPYVICLKEGAKSPAERAFHPDEVSRSNGDIKVDVEWYISQQIMPPISRLCEPIEGTSPAILAERLGLDKSRFASHVGQAPEADSWGFTPMCRMEDAERFKDSQVTAPMSHWPLPAPYGCTADRRCGSAARPAGARRTSPASSTARRRQRPCARASYAPTLPAARPSGEPTTPPRALRASSTV